MLEQTPEPPPFRPPGGTLVAEDPTFRGWKEPKHALARNRRRILVGLVALVVVGLGAGVAARPAYRWVRGWRARSIAEESLKLSDEGKPSAAVQKAKVAYRLAPAHPLPLRAVATALMASGHTQPAIAFWEKLIQSEQATAEDRERYIEAQLGAGQFAQGQAALEKLIALSGENVRTLLLSARLKLAQGEEIGALEDSRRAVELGPSNGFALTFLAGLKLKSAATARAGEEELLALGAEQTSSGLNALTVLASAGELSIEATDKVATALERHPFATERHRLKSLELQWRAKPNERDRLLDRAGARYGTEAMDPQFRSEFAGLLLKLQSPERVLAFLPLEQALTRRDWLAVHLDALSAQNRWEEILAVLAKAPPALPTPVVELYRARCAEGLGKGIEGKAHWRKGLSQASGNPELLLYFAQYAERLGRRDEARIAYGAMQEVLGAAEYAKQQLTRLGERSAQ